MHSIDSRTIFQYNIQKQFAQKHDLNSSSQMSEHDAVPNAPTLAAPIHDRTTTSAAQRETLRSSSTLGKPEKLFCELATG